MTHSDIIAPNYLDQVGEAYDLILEESSLMGEDYVKEVVVSNPNPKVSKNFFYVTEPVVVTRASGGGYYMKPLGRVSRPVWVKENNKMSEGDILIPGKDLFYNSGDRKSQGLYSLVENTEKTLEALANPLINQVPGDLEFLEKEEVRDIQLDQARKKIKGMKDQKEKAKTLESYLI